MLHEAITKPERGGEMASLIINGKKYALEKRNLLCEVCERNTYLIFDFDSVTKKLYYPKGKEFILVSSWVSGKTITEILSEKQAKKFLNSHPECIVEENYIKFFGEPEDV